MRLFVGVRLEDDARRRAVRAADAVAHADPSWVGEKWVNAADLHITLQFIGNVPDEEVHALEAVLAEEILPMAPFELVVDRVRAVPHERRARMLWLSFLDPEGGCGRLAEAVGAASVPFGAKLDERPFTPHATLVRARRPHAISAEGLAAANDPFSSARRSMSVPSATLLSSRLTPQGPVYSEVRTWRLDG